MEKVTGEKKLIEIIEDDVMEDIVSKLTEIVEGEEDLAETDADKEKRVTETDSSEEEIDKEDLAETDADKGKRVTEAGSSEIVSFAMKTSEKMRELGILTLNITQYPQEIMLTTWFETYKLSCKKSVEIIPSPSSNTSSLLSPRRKSNLSATAIKLGQLLHHLLSNINKLPIPPPTMNPVKLEKPDTYNQILLRKLEKDVVDFSDDIFLNVDEYSGMDYRSKENEEVVVSEVDLLTNNEDEIRFNFQKEEAIKKLSHQIGKIYNKILEEYLEEEIKRRNKFRFYVNILEVKRRIEVYCSLYKTRSKGETIKNQATKKILSYNSNISSKDFKNIIRASRRIESLIKVAGNNYNIVDAFPNLYVNFFKSTNISVHNYECWLKLVETGREISEEKGKSIYLLKKEQENKARKDELAKIYHLANMNSSDLISNINWGDDE